MANLEIQNISTLEDQGKVLSEQWAKIEAADKKRFKLSTKAEGFDTQLGKLMVELKAEGGDRIPSQRLRDCHLHLIDKRRRSEALWFVENESECRAFIETSKKGFTSLSALQRAMKQKDATSKEVAETVSEAVPVSEAETPSEAVVKSDVGPVTKQVVFDKLIKVCLANDIDPLDLAEMLMEYDSVSASEEAAKAAA
tara:strand:+ start:1988 stop:2578 length:591 start_codon:yes stop_codon:yes gene_type:complete